MKLVNQIDELIQAGVISAETGAAIEHYLQHRKINHANQNRLMIAFGILGATLIGLGIILIIAHNWDNLSRSIKTIFAFLPLVIGQGVGVYVLLKRNESSAWREGVAVFIFFGVAACISMVSQIYNIPGDMAGFLLTWMLLSLPLFYLLRSSITGLLYLIGITAYAVAEGYFKPGSDPVWLFWGMLLAFLPYYLYILRKSSGGNFTSFYNWLVPAALLVSLGLFANNSWELMLMAYLLMLGSFYLTGKLKIFTSLKLIGNGFYIIGILGSLGILLFLSFDIFWKEWHKLSISSIVNQSELWIVLFFTICFLLLIYMQKWRISAMNWLLVIVLISLFVGLFNEYVPIWLINLYYLLIGIWYIREGAQRNHLGILNFGLVVIASLVVARFFDANLSFVVRGLLFLLVGAGFFVANYRLIKRRKEQIV